MIVPHRNVLEKVASHQRWESGATKQKHHLVCEVSEDTDAENARSGRGVEVSSPCTPPSSPGMVSSRWQAENCQSKRFQCQFEQVDVA